jgi:peptidoglycan hydrolase-like protein with peptidoglycan-binding domain
MRNITDLHPRLQALIGELKFKCEQQGLIIGIGECLRTVAEQDALYAQGRTVPGSIVTNAKGSTYSSQHQWGIAFDFYRNDGSGAYNESGNFFEKVGASAKSIGLGWGGDWTSIKDRPHLYLPDWGSTTTRLRNQYGAPDKFMTTWGCGVQAAETPTAAPVEESKPTPAPAPTATTGYTQKQFIKDVQAATGSKVDGIAGSETIGNTVTISATTNRKHKVVVAIQQRLNALGYNCGTADGIAGPKFTAAVNNYQKKVLGYNKPDGELTARGKMWRSLLGM